MALCPVNSLRADSMPRKRPGSPRAQHSPLKRLKATRSNPEIEKWITSVSPERSEKKSEDDHGLLSDSDPKGECSSGQGDTHLTEQNLYYISWGLYQATGTAMSHSF